MEAREFQRLEELSTDDTRARVAEGISLVADNVSHLLEQAESVREEAPRLAEIARLHAGEEAGKALILLDYVRPPAGVDQGDLSRHVRSAGSHLARGLYVQYYRMSPATFGEALNWIHRERQSHYLDGPEGVEWIFRNRILDRRESVLYVDYVEQEGELRWRSPLEHAVRWEGMAKFFSVPRICRVLLALDRLALIEAEALARLSRTWSDVELTEETRWGECRQLNDEWLTSCLEADLVRRNVDGADDYLGFVRERLYWPICGADLSLHEVWAEVEERREGAMANYGRFM